MISPLLVTLALVAADGAPPRWLPVVFERAAFLQTNPPVLLTDLGRFRYTPAGWRREPAAAGPVVAMLRPQAAAAADRELLLAPEAAVALSSRENRLVVLRRELQRPVVVPLPAHALRASSLRLVASPPDAWLVQGVAVAGDARVGVFLLRVPRASLAVGFVRAFLAAEMPAFLGSVSHGGALWLLPDAASASQAAWVFEAGRWRQAPPPTAQSVLLDAAVGQGALFLAYSDGVLRVAAEGQTWHPLEARLTSPAWLCPGRPGAAVRGRWVRGEALVGWGVGATAPSEAYPLDGASCAFYTQASGTEGLAMPDAVSVSLR